MKTMKKQASCLISSERISRLKVQGFDRGYTNEEISGYALGNRFAFQICTLLFTTGLILKNIPVLALAAIIAFFGVILPYHPFDYLYNNVMRHWLNRRKLPRRSNQAKFACGMASAWLAIIIFLFYHSYFVWGYILGGILLVIALLVSIMDFCIPSIIYNKLFRKKLIL